MIQLPSRVLLKKKSNVWHQRLIGTLLSPFNDRYMSSYWTTIGRTIYVPTKYDKDLDWAEPSWIDRHEPVIAHELVHVAQDYRRGHIIHALMYLGPAPFVLPAILIPLILGDFVGVLVLVLSFLALLPLSIGLAYGRWLTEREAYQVSRSYGRPHERIVRALWSDYLFTWPKQWMVNWFENNPAPPKTD